MLASKATSVVLRTKCLSKLTCGSPSVIVRCMARGRNYYISGASKQTGISPETRDLIANVCHSENIDVWQREPGIGDPITFAQYRENPDDIDNDSDLDMVYFPHKGEQPWPQDYQPSPVFLVKRVKDLRGVPWWHKQDCERIGLGIFARLDKVVALPNLSYYNALLYRIKHLVEIRPVEFPNGIPTKEEFDVHNAKVTHDGKFLYHPKIGEQSKVLLGQGPLKADRQKMTEETHKSESRKSWLRPYNSPFGNSNYHRDLKKRNPEKFDHITDATNTIKY